MYAAAVSAVGIFAASELTKNPLAEVEIIVPLIPAAVGVAILKYRLYEIDRLIAGPSRTRS